ncbi:MAG: ArdC-like ssDNA-binding domain-containing protein [Pseudolabrys sp.]
MYQTITDQIFAKLERGVRSWMKPWSETEDELRASRRLFSVG